MGLDLTTSGTCKSIEGPLMFLRRNVDIGLNEAIEVMGKDGAKRLGRVAILSDDVIGIEVLETTTGLSLQNTRVRFLAEPLTMALGPGLLGRVFNGVGLPMDGGPPIPEMRRVRIDGQSINPAFRETPVDFIETGISSIDLMNSLVRGQKLPLFSGGGLPHDRIAIDIARRAKLRGGQEKDFAIVFVGIGIPHDTAETFRAAMETSGALEHTVIFLNLADMPSPQRLLTPRFALTAAEHLAYEEGRHVLVIMTDMTNYCEALREVSSSHGEIPSRKGYPGYMYSDLASIFERAGAVRGLPGTVTQLPILTMPGDDIGHPIPDLTGYITEGQIVLDRDLFRKGVTPPVNVLPSLSRMMNAGIGEGFTDKNHPALSNQLFAAYARSVRVRVLASVVGRASLPQVDQLYLEFGNRFETELVHQTQSRSLEESMAIGWRLLNILPVHELSRLSDEQIMRYLNNPERSHAPARS